MSLRTNATAYGHSMSLRGSWSAAQVILLLLLLMATPQLALAQADPPPPPNANPRSVTTLEDTAVTIDTGISFDPRYQIAIVTPGPVHGDAVGGVSSGNFAIIYTPGANQTNAVSFSYQLCTTVGAPICGQSALVTVTITPVNDGPIAGADTATVKFGQSLLFNVLANDNGGINEIDSVTLVAGGVSVPSPDGTAVIEGNQIRYTAPAAPAPCIASSNATFTYLVQDGSGLQAAGTVTVTRTCPGTPTLKLGPPYAFLNHTFKIDVILESVDVNVAALDFFLTYDTCVTDVDTPSNSMVADDVTNMPLGPSFHSQVQDETFATRTLHFISASTTSPASILAGPDASATRTIATIQFKAVANCTPTNFTFSSAGFTGVNALAITGATENRLAEPLAAANTRPTNITLSNNKVPENSSFNTFIGQFATTDPDVGDTFTYAFVAPHFDAGGRFRIRPLAFNNDELAVGSTAAAPGLYNISVSATDNYGGVFTKNFVIEVTDRNLFAPFADDDGTYFVQGRKVIPFRSTTPVVTDLVDGDYDPDVGHCNNCSIQSVTNGSKGLVTNLGASVVYIPTDAKFINNTDVFTYTLTDNDPAGALTAKARVTVYVQPDAMPGNCNRSTIPAPSGIEAGDLTATGLEIFDGDGSAWYNIYQGTYTNFSSYGCNSNQDAVVDAGDIACTAQKIFNNSYVCGTTLAASSATAATLAVGSGLNAASGATVQVPVVLGTAGHAVAAAAFALEFNSDEVSFDATDADNDGVADAVALNIPSGLLATASYNAAASRIEIVVTGLIPPFPHLADGALATITLRVKDGVNVNATTVRLTNSSLGSDEGQSVPLEVSDGAIQIGTQPANRILLPLIRMQ